MKRYELVPLLSLAILAVAAAAQAQTVQCANGVYRAGCVGPNGAAVVNKSRPVQPIYVPPVHRPAAVVVGQPGYRAPAVVVARPAAVIVAPLPPPPRSITCVNGVYRAGCVGPNGAVVVNK